VLIKLGLDQSEAEPEPESGPEPEPEPEQAEVCLETESPPPAADQVSSLDEAIRQLEELQPQLAEPTLASGATAAKPGVPEEVAEAVVYWLTRYSANRAEAARNLRELAAKEPAQVADAALPLCAAGRWGEASRFLASLLSSQNQTVAKLCDPAASLDGSIRVARTLSRHEPRFDARFAKSLLNDEEMTEDARRRGLAILEKLGSGGRLIPILIQFLRDPDTRTRSKAALMFGQIMPTQGIMDRLMGDEDARVRANFVEGLWNCTTSDCRPLFRHALKDAHHRVVGSALVGLHRLGETRDVVTHVGKMVRRPEAPFRAAAAWAMGQTGEKLYAGVLRQMVRDPDPMVRSNALRSLRRINLAGAASSDSEEPAGVDSPGG
jgi:HEAT repeat protein